jgi:hypothetical protein
MSQVTPIETQRLEVVARIRKIEKTVDADDDDGESFYPSAYWKDLREKLKAASKIHDDLVNQIMEIASENDLTQLESLFVEVTELVKDLKGRIEEKIEDSKVAEAKAAVEKQPTTKIKSKSSKANPVRDMKAAEIKLRSCEKFKTSYKDDVHSASLLAIQSKALESLQIQYELAFDQCLDGVDDNQLEELAAKRETFNDRWCNLSSWLQDEITRRSPPPASVAQPATSGKLNDTCMSTESNRASHKQRADFFAKQLVQYEVVRREFGEAEHVVSVYDLRSRLKALEPLREKYEAAMLECIEELNNEDEKKEAEDSFAAVSSRFFDIIAWFAEQVEKQSKSKSDGGSTTTSARRPKIDNPTFDGKAVNWLAFHDLYSELIHNSTISTSEKYHILRKSIQLPSGEVNVLDGIPFGADHYQTAWDAICARYSDKRKIIAAHYDLLMNVEAMIKESAEELRRIIDSFSTNIKALANIGFKLEDKFSNSFVVHIMVSRLDKQTLKEWKKSTTDESSTYEALNEFLLKQWKSLSDVPAQTKKSHENSSHSKPARTHTAVGEQQRSSEKCCMCGGSHWVNNCDAFLKMSAESRRNLIMTKKLCVNCFSAKHFVGKCTRAGKCKKCSGKHHPLLHIERTPANSSSQKQQQGSSSELSKDSKPFTPFVQNTVAMSLDVSKTFSSASDQLFPRRRALLTTARVDVLDQDGNVGNCRALIDSGSDTNYISSKLVKKLNLAVFSIAMRVEGIDAKPTIVKSATKITIQSRYGEFIREITCAILPRVTGPLPTSLIDVEEVKIPEGLFLADPQFNKIEPVDLLLGNIIDNEIKLSEQIKLHDDLTLNHTKFGWTISGAMPGRSEATSSSHLATGTTLLSSFPAPRITNDELSAQMEKFFTLEEVEGVTMMSPDEKQCEEFFKETTTRGPDGKFVVRMQLKPEIEKLGNNLRNATRQFFAQEARREKNEVEGKLYVDYMSEYISSGHMTEVKPTAGESAYYLPHHGVLKLTSTTTKLRPVFNASSKSESGISLNDVMRVGPTVQPESFDILLRLREQPYVILGDVEKMYRQIWIHPSERKYQRILWRAKRDEILKHYQLNTVTFGTASAPYLATRSIVQLALDNQQQFPEEAAILLDSVYVDDLEFGVGSIAEGIERIANIRKIFESAGMRLRKIISNHPDILVDVPLNDIEKTTDEAIIKALGVGYAASSDVFVYRLKPMKEGPLTKAGILGDIFGIYDPLGLIGPVVLKAKLFMKQLSDIDWKDQIPDKVQEGWNEFRSTFSALNELKIPRFCYIPNGTRYELHGFSDASESAYGASVYIRAIDKNGKILSSLLCAKSRVSPKNLKTLARLELCAALLLAKLIRRVLRILRQIFIVIILWCDATIVLYWIKLPPSMLSTFVANRVAMIQELTKGFIWRHIAGIMNPADVISRGRLPSEIIDCHLWWNGPPFFMQDESEWPESIVTVNEKNPEIVAELRRVKTAVRVSSLFEEIENSSDTKKLINIFAFIKRFANNAWKASMKHFGPLSIAEREAGEFAIIRIIQETLFPEDYRLLSKQRHQIRENPSQKVVQQVSRKSDLLSLTPFMDDNLIIRVGGRIRASPELTFNQKHQIILPICQFTKSLVRFLHLLHSHPPQQTLLGIVRERYWPIKAGVIIKSVTNQCLKCYRARPRTGTQLMADLNTDRVTMQPSFNASAVDNTGHYNIKGGYTRNAAVIKCYVTMFKCLCTGAVHLEAVTELSTAAFIAALDRFVSRRGLCSVIYSDNGTCFRGADNEFKRLMESSREEIVEHCAQKAIEWNFTTPLAPHAGGFYESGIKSVKHCLKRILDDRPLNYEQFTTTLCRVEAILNSRPLTPISNDPNDLQVLTPAHFLTGRSLVARPEKDFTNANSSRLVKWELVQQMAQRFWQAWYHDYLHHLQKRPVGFRERVTFKVGDMVLVKDNNLPPMKWKMGRIIKLFPGRNQAVRNFQIRTADGIVERNIRYLCLLPLEESPAVGESVPAGTASF